MGLIATGKNHCGRQVSFPVENGELNCDGGELVELEIPEGVKKVNCEYNKLTKLVLPKGGLVKFLKDYINNRVHKRQMSIYAQLVVAVCNGYITKAKRLGKDSVEVPIGARVPSEAISLAISKLLQRRDVSKCSTQNVIRYDTYRLKIINITFKPKQ